MASDATSRQIESRKNVIFWTLIIFLALVIIAIIGAIISNISPKVKTEAEEAREAAAEAIEQGNEEREIFPIVAHLPVKNSLFTLGYQFSDGGQKLTLKVTTTETYLDSAIEKLSSFGVDLTNCALEVNSPDVQNTSSVGGTLPNPFLSAYIMNDASDPVAALRRAYAKVDNFQVASYLPLNSEGVSLITADPNASEVSADADYVVTKITTGYADRYNLQTYRLVLQKNESNQWLPVANPAPLLNIYNTPNISPAILQLANQL